MTEGQQRPARRHGPPTAVPFRRAAAPRLAPEPDPAGYASSVRPRRPWLSVVLVGAVLVVLSLLLGSLGEVSWPWENSTINGSAAADVSPLS